jgi:hypothetical protein
MVDLITPTQANAISIGVNVTIPHISSSLSKKSYLSIPSITRTHLASIHSKLQGRTSSSSQGDEVISALSSQRTALIPFTVDHLGGLGPFAVAFLFHPCDSPVTALPPTPVASYNFTSLLHVPLMILSQAHSSIWLTALPFTGLKSALASVLVAPITP